MGTDLHPATNLCLGLWKVLALIPFAVFVAAIDHDFANHSMVQRVLRRVPEAS
jgi:hypothetical protein